MQAGCLSKKNQLISRRSLLGVFGASVVSAAPVFTNAAGFIKGAGDIRKLKMISKKDKMLLTKLGPRELILMT